MKLTALEKILQNQQKKTTTRTPSFELLTKLPFWIINKQEHKQRYIRSKGFCCFSHAVGLPYKPGQKRQPWWPYQEIFLEAKKEHKYIRVIKATGLGFSEFELYYMAWMAFKHTGNPHSKPAQMVIICGPNVDIAQQLIARLVAILTSRLFDLHESIETTKITIQIGNVQIKAFPSNHIDAVRALPNPIYILLDEADFFNIAPDDPNNVVKVVERYIAKSDPYIILISTPNLPGGLFHTMDNDSKSRYYTLRFNYEWGLGKIYDHDQIEIQRKSSSFEREYNLKYGYGVGNIFEETWIQLALERGRKLQHILPQKHTSKSMGVDPAFGSSLFGITIIEHLKYVQDETFNNTKRVFFSKGYEREQYETMLDTCYKFIKDYNINFIFVDGSQVEFIKSLKSKIGEDPNYETQIERARKYGTPLHNYMSILPILNQEYNEKLIQDAKYWFGQSKTMAIDESQCDALVGQMRMAKQNDAGKLDKTSKDMKLLKFDQLESLLYALQFFVHV